MGIIKQYKSAFDLIAKNNKDDEGNSIDVWYARELQQVLGYARWENFVVAIGHAIESCKTLEISIDDHFRDLTKMISQRTLSIGATPKCLKPMRLCKSQRKHLNLDFSCKLI
jgi:hypothetical protein